MERGHREILRAIELFAGAGGLMLGLESAGFSTVVANEVHADPCKTLRRNFSEVPLLEGSIGEITAADLLDKTDNPEIDLIAGGPPCQGFSTAGLKDPVDPRNTLIGDFVRVVQEVRPRFFLLENVTGLLTLHGGRLFENVQCELDRLGYRFDHRVLHAADFGVPQMRKRLVVLGARDGAPPNPPEPRFRPGAETTLLDATLPVYVSCGDALGDIPDISPGEICRTYERRPETPYQRRMRRGETVLRNHQASRHRTETTDYYALVPPGGTWLDIPPELRKRKQGIQRWPLDGLARTITSEPTDFLHPTQNRIPTIRELARIQSFPDHFEFMGQRTTGNRMRRLGYCAQSQQVGNAVPPLLAEAVGDAVYAAATEAPGVAAVA